MRKENFPKLKRSDHSPKRDEFIDVSSDPSYFSLDSPFKARGPATVSCDISEDISLVLFVKLWLVLLRRHIDTSVCRLLAGFCT